MSEVWYRYVDVFGQHRTGGEVYVLIEELRLVPGRQTPKGVWLYDSMRNKERWVSSSSRKAWAYPNKAEAWASFRRRRVVQVNILSGQLARARLSLQVAQGEAFSHEMSQAPTHKYTGFLTSVTD